MLCLVFLVRCCGVLIKISKYQLIKDKQLVFTSSLGRGAVVAGGCKTYDCIIVGYAVKSNLYIKVSTSCAINVIAPGSIIIGMIGVISRPSPLVYPAPLVNP